MINNVALTGRLTKDVEIRFTGNGKAVGNGTLAVDRQFKNAQGEKETDFINFVIWGKSAEALANYTKKGSLIGITGRLQVRTYDNNEGRKVWVTEVVAENFTFLESKKDASNGSQSYGQVNTQGGYQSQPNTQNSMNNDPFVNNGAPIDISDDDLPF